MSVGNDPVWDVSRVGDELITSNPQNHVYEPLTVSVAVLLGPPSRLARSPGYWRTTIGLAAVPFKVLEKVPEYVPPRSQTVSPGRTGEGWLKAVWRSHGLVMLPFPLGPPSGAT